MPAGQTTINFSVVTGRIDVPNELDVAAPTGRHHVVATASSLASQKESATDYRGAVSGRWLPAWLAFVSGAPYSLPYVGLGEDG